MAPKPKAGGTKKPTAKAPKRPTEKSQRERFIETARELGVDESGEEFERAMARIVPSREGKRSKSPP